MSENLTRINSFFHFLRDIIKENPNINFSKDVIYDWITKLEVSGDEYDINIAKEGWFKEWQTTFAKNDRTNKSIIAYFCRFGNKENEVMALNNPLKIYIPINYEHLKLGFEKIMNFLNENDIAYQAKVAKEIRIDNIVIRVANIDDAKKIVDFINSDKYIKEGLGKPSPFCFNYKGIAFTLDANTSFHNTVASYVYNYINNKKKCNDLEKIECEDFYNYVKELYTNEYEKFTEFSKIQLPNFNRKVSYERSILTDKEITKLLISANKENFGEKEFFEMYNEFNDDEKINEEKNELCVLRCIAAIIKIHGKKYGVDDALNAIKGYLSSGNPIFITSTCSLRDEVLATNFIEKLKRFLAKYNTTIEELFLLIANDEIKVLEFVDKSEKEISLLKFNVDDKLTNILNTLAEYETEELSIKNPDMKHYEAIQEAMKTAMQRFTIFMASSNANSITRRKNLRQKCFAIRSDLLTILYNTNTNLQSYMNILIKNSPLLKQSVLEEAIYTTYTKYQKFYEDGQIQYDGEDFTCYSLDMLITQGNYDGFTSESNSRRHLELVSKEDALNIVNTKLNKKIDLDNCNEVDRICHVKRYVSQFLKDNIKEINKDSISLK